jgi:hypothetical protein
MYTYKIQKADHSGGGAAFTNNRKKILSLPTNLQGMI